MLTTVYITTFFIFFLFYVIANITKGSAHGRLRTLCGKLRSHLEAFILLTL